MSQVDFEGIWQKRRAGAKQQARYWSLGLVCFLLTISSISWWYGGGQQVPHVIRTCLSVVGLVILVGFAFWTGLAVALFLLERNRSADAIGRR